jgi:hypothetical protein
MSSPVECLPVEVFHLVAAHLDLPAYQALRLSSRRLYRLTHSIFAKRHFCDLTTTLGPASLDRLINISNHQHLRDSAKVLDIRLLNHRDYKILTTITRVGIFPPPKRFPIVSGVRTVHITQEATTYHYVVKSEYPSRLFHGLVRVLRGLGNLKIVRFRAHHAEPLGWRKTGMPDGDQIFRTKCFHVVIDALIESGVHLEEFSMAKGKRTTTLSKAANVPYPVLQLPHQSLRALRPCFSHLASLTLSVVTNYNGDSRIPGWENSIGNLIATAPKLKNLALSLDRSTHLSHYSAAVVRSLALSCQLPELETFQLVNCSLHEEHLVAFVRSHTDSLNQVVFSDLCLLTGNWSSLWPILKTCEGLRCLRLASLQGISSPVVFRRRDKERPKITLNVEKDERLMSAMLDDLIVGCDVEDHVPITNNGID